MNTVDTSMGDKDFRALQDFKLRYGGTHNKVRRDGTKQVEVGLSPHRQDELRSKISEGLEACPEKLRLGGMNRAQRNVDDWLLLQSVEWESLAACLWVDGGANKGEGLV